MTRVRSEQMPDVFGSMQPKLSFEPRPVELAGAFNPDRLIHQVGGASVDRNGMKRVVTLQSTCIILMVCARAFNVRQLVHLISKKVQVISRLTHSLHPASLFE